MKATRSGGDVEGSTGQRGSAAGSPGLTALDEEREASLADEGGASGAAIESQERVPRRPPAARRRAGSSFWVLAGAVAAGALGALALRKRR